ncbi:hypothetical protein [Cellulomonas sp. URHE0023]|uniref:hypothetical protein n=1 Tax=Cellulomonas sp. URHE0023 TaxID=1380354 RepID=UPI0004851F8C|nr:hypothetical protein [Cellulomonas sp. URHE0023]
MKTNKLTAVGATLALVVVSVLGLSTAADAAYVPVTDIVTETTPYPVEQWFLGNPVGPALTQDATGLTIPGQNQLLYGRAIPGATGAEFQAFIEGVSFVGTGPLTFQVTVYLGPGTAGFTTLRPSTTGSPTAATTWISSQAVGGLPADTPVPFAQIVAAFVADNATVLGSGVFVNPGDTAVLSSFTSGAETWTFATPAAPVTPPVVAPPVTPPVAAPPATPPAAPAATPVSGTASFTG